MQGLVVEPMQGQSACIDAAYFGKGKGTVKKITVRTERIWAVLPCTEPSKALNTIFPSVDPEAAAAPMIIKRTL